MPHVSVKIIEGKPQAQLDAIAKAVEKAVVDQGVSEKYVSVRLEEVPRGDWMKTVYNPEIEGGSGTLYKKPGYDSI